MSHKTDSCGKNIFTISLNEPDNIGIATQLKYIPENIEIRHDIHNYDDYMSDLVKKNHLKAWWFTSSSNEEHINVIMRAVNKRHRIPTNDNTKLVVVDRGGIMFEAVCIATIAVRDKCDLKEAQNTYKLIIEKLGIKFPYEDIRILLKHGHNPEDSIQRILMGEISSDKTYQKLLQKQLEIQENENSYTHIINVAGKSIIQVQNEIRQIINECCCSGVENIYPLILQNVELVIGFGGMSESGKSSLAEGICHKLQSIGVKCVRLKIEYFMELVSKALDELSTEKQADELLKQLDHYLRQHYWITAITIESFHSIELIEALRKLLDDKFYLIYVDTTLNTRVERSLDRIEILQEKDNIKMSRGMDKIKSIAHLVINNDQYTLNESINHIYEAIKEKNEKILGQFNLHNTSAEKINLHSDQFVLSAGTVLIRKSTCEVCLLYLFDERNVWCLPKGRKNINETLSEAALRETYEETGYHCSLMPVTMQTRATPSNAHVEDEPREVDNACEPFFISVRPIEGNLRNRKFIFWYVAQVDEQIPRELGTQMINENFQVKFESLDEAIRLLSFDEDKELVQRAFQVFEKTYPNN